MVKTALLRTDGSNYLGMGHIMRCIALAQGLNKIKIKSVFSIRNYDKKISELIQSYGYMVEMIPYNCNLIEDVYITLNLASKHKSDLIITDLSNKNMIADSSGYARYIKAIKDFDKFLVMIDGFGKECINLSVRLPSNILIIPYYGAKGKNYKITGSTRLLAGASYFIFRQEFIEAAMLNRQIRRNAKNILVTMGGSDPFKLTVKIAKALVKLNRTLLNLRIVIGPGFNVSIKQELERILRSFNGNYELVIENFDMAELMLWSDLAITSSGLTKYETAVTGTPSIIISYDDFQEKIMDEFKKYGSALHLGQGKNIHEDDMAKVVDSLLNDSDLRKQMSKRGRDLVDGKGVEKVISQIQRSYCHE